MNYHNHKNNTSKDQQRRREAEALGTRPPGEVLQEMYESGGGGGARAGGIPNFQGDNSLNGETNDIATFLSSPEIQSEARASIQQALEQHQDATDTVRVANTQPSNNNVAAGSDGGSGLADLFNRPPTPAAPSPPQQELVEFQEPGVIDFRQALLAEQRQQQEMLQERQRRFDERNRMESELSKDNTADDSLISVESNKPSHKPTRSILRNSSTTVPRPESILQGGRGSTEPSVLDRPNVGHNRTVSFSLDNRLNPNPQITSTDNQMHSIMEANRAASLAPSHARTRSRILTEESYDAERRISLLQLVGTSPIESEAETNILKAVDDLGLQDQVTTSRHSITQKLSDIPMFFNNIPNDYTFPADEVNEGGELASDNTTTPNQIQHQKSFSGGSNGTGGTTSNRTHHRKNTSDESGGTRRSSAPQRAGKKRPSLPSKASSRHLTSTRNLNRQPKRGGHRHTQSIEMKLFGLTKELSRLDANALHQMKIAGINDDSEFDYDDSTALDDYEEPTKKMDENPSSSGSLLKKGHKRVVSSADRLAERAQTLVTHAFKPSGKSDNKPTSTSSMFRQQSSRTFNDIEKQEAGTDPETGLYQDISNTSRGSRGRGKSNGVKDGVSRRESSSNDSERTGRPSVASHQHPSIVIEEEDDESGSFMEDENKPKRKSWFRRTTLVRSGFGEGVAETAWEEWEAFSEFFSPLKGSIWSYCRTLLFYIIVPSTATATILFYFVGNPMVSEGGPSWSWLILFVGVRQIITLSLAIATQSFLIDFVILGTSFSFKFLGPAITLLLVQSKGWPFIATFWAIYDFALLAFSTRFVQHWAYWQGLINMCNANNPSGKVTNNPTYLLLLRIMIAVGITVALKRLLVGIMLGRQTFVHYGEELAKVMNKMLLVSEVGSLSRMPLPRIEADEPGEDSNRGEESVWVARKLSTIMMEDESTKSISVVDNTIQIPDLLVNGDMNTEKAATEKGNTEETSSSQEQKSYGSNVPTEVGGINGFVESERQQIMDQLESWEEPERAGVKMNEKVTLAAVLQFRRAQTLLRRRYPFSPAFGRCDTREACVDSTQNVFERLLRRNAFDEDDLSFDVLAVLARNPKGELDEAKLKSIIKVFRPDRDGRLTRLAFVKSVDAVYKRMRLLSCNIHNSQQIDVAVENILNVAFYFILATVILGVLGLNPMQIFYSLSSFVLAFAFMFGNAAAKYFEGVLLILVQRPFGVGDRIHVSNSEQDLSPDGSPGWIVEDLNLFHTTVCYGTTNERATVSNGTLAISRIVNAARSPNALVYVNLKFGIDVPYDRVQIFQTAVESHVKARPREWLGFRGFRACGISVDLGFIQYTVVVQHREAWQHVVTILESKARLTTYCHEVAKQLDMRYVSPKLPVALSIEENKGKPLLSEMLNSNGNNNPIDSVSKTA